MKQIRICSWMVIQGVCLVFLSSGCMPVTSSPTPRFYMLQAVGRDEVREDINMSLNLLVGIGPVKIPAYQDRPQMVTRDKEKMVKFAPFDRWGESLESGMARLIREDLTAMLPASKFLLYPLDQTSAVQYQVTVEIVQLDSELDKDLFLVAQWQVIDTQNMKTILIKRSALLRPITPQNYAGLAETLSMSCAALSREIAQALAELNARP